MKRQSLKKPLINGIIIGLFITSSSLSILMFVGYSALGLENRTPLFEETMPRRYFPSDSEMDLLKFLRNNLNIKNDDNVAIPENESKVYRGLSSKLEGFVGLPLPKIFQSPLTLQESSIEGFYTLLDYSNTRFIVLPKQLVNTYNTEEILRFALENFKKVYEDHKYIVLSVPPLAPPSTEEEEGGGDVALVYPHALDHFNIPLSSSTILNYSKSLFMLDSSQLSKVNERTATLKGNETIWSNTISLKNTNYMEATFRIVDEYKAKQNHSGIVWNDGYKDYYVFLRSNIISIYTPEEGEFKSAPIQERTKGQWFTLKVVYVNGMINVFLNDTLKLQIPSNSTNIDISKVGIRSFNTITEFKPPKIGVTSPLNTESARFGPQHKYNYYYSVSALALSKIRYDIFAEDDYSAFSKKNVVLTSDPVNANSYLEFAKKGGNIIVLNTDNGFKDGFSNLLCIKPYKDIEFDSIASSKGGQQHLKAFGMARDVGVHCQGSIIKSFYMNNGHEVAPFVIEKKYGNGKIIFVNISGYFKTLAKSDRFFLTLGSITDLIGLDAEKFTKTVTLNSAPIPYFIGDLDMSGPVIINSSSLLLSKNYDLHVQNISITNQKSTNFFEDILSFFFSWFYHSSLNQTNFINTQVSDLRIYGAYNVVIDSPDLLYVPSSLSSSSSPYNYIQLDLPVGSNMTIKLFNGSRAEFFIGKDNNQQPIEVSDGKIEFKRIKSGLLSNVTTSIPVLMKTPEITINKKTTFQAVRSHYPDNPTKPWADLWPLEAKGKTTIKLDHANNDANNTRQYITYFKWIEVNTDKNEPKQPHGELLEIPWQEIINSDINIKLMVSTLVIAIVSIYLLWSPSKLKKWESAR